MTFTLIGTGNMAHFLALRCKGLGWQCKGVWGRDKAKVCSLAAFLETEIIASLSEITDDCDYCILAVTDSAIAEIAAQLSLVNTIVVHTAGSQSLAILPQENKAVVWPVYSIAQANLPMKNDFPVVYETSHEMSAQKAKELAMVMSSNVVAATWQQRQWMHLIATFGNNFTNHIMAICEQLAHEQDLSFDLFKPILEQTFERVKETNPVNAQTGAAKRNDENTMRTHFELLKYHPVWQALYEKFSASIKDMYSSKGK